MQALKALVISMGALIFIMMGVVGYGIVVKFNKVVDPKKADGPTVPAGETAAEGSWGGNVRIAIPVGARVAETVVEDGRMVVRLTLPDDSQRYLVFDLNTGRQVGAIDLAPRVGGQ